MVLSYALEPLGPEGFQHALLALELRPNQTSIDKNDVYSEELLLSICAGVVMEDENSAIRFAHYTAQTFFVANRERLFENAQTSFTNACIAYLSLSYQEIGLLPIIHDIFEWIQTYPFYEYCARCWGHHARKVEIVGREVIDFLECRPKVEATLHGLTRYWPRRYDKPITGFTGLHLVAYFGIQTAVKSLLSQYCINIRNSDNRTPMSYAAEQEHDAVVTLLLAAHGVDPDFKDTNGQTPLTYAAKNGHDRVVRLLLEDARVDPCATDTLGWTPLSGAAAWGRWSVVRRLLADNRIGAANDKGYLGDTALSLAAHRGHVAVVKLLLAHNGIDPNPQDSDGQCPLLLAAKYGHVKVVKMLLDKNGIDLNRRDATGRTPLAWAAQRGHDTVVELLLAHRASVQDVDEDGDTPLSLASKKGHHQVIKLLLANRRVDVNAKDARNGCTALFWGTIYDHEAVVRLLLDNGANVEVKDEHGRTPLQFAIDLNCKPIELLLRRATTQKVKQEFT